VVFFRRRVGDGACSFRFSAGHFGLDAPRWSILSAGKSRRIITVLVELRPAMVLISLCHQEQTQKTMEGIVQLWDRMLPRWFWSTWLWNHCAIMWLWFRRDVPPGFVPWYGFGSVLQIFKNSVVGQK
jgi:hypothetical protein